MKSFEDFTMGEILNADFRARSVFKNFGIDSTTFKDKTVKEICKRHQIQADYLLDSIIENMDSKVVVQLEDVN